MTSDFPAMQDEKARLATLDRYDILNSPPEVIFDELARMAASICGTPIALVSLVDETRQWFKARIGIEATETPREIAFCAHAIHGAEPFIVPDATLDERFAGNPLVTGPLAVRFYAGAPLLAPDGEALGTLCVLDNQPRQLSQDKIEALQLLSRHVVAQLELRRQVKLLSQQNAERSTEMSALVNKQQQQIDRLTYYNPLTGLANRELFLKRLSHELSDVARRAGQAALFVVELQRFDLITEALGSEGMDVLLNEIASRVVGCAEDALTVAQLRDERFVLFRRSIGSATQAAMFAEKDLLRRLNQNYNVQGQEVRPSFKIGIALSPADATQSEPLLRAAKTGLVTAAEGQGPIAFCSPETGSRVAGALTLEAKLRRALEREEFVLHYQPKIDLRTGRLTGVEALLRWADPDGATRIEDCAPRLIPPARFIPMLEETRLIVPVGLWVMRQAATDCADWKLRGINVPRVAVNVSTLQLQQSSFVTDVSKILTSHGTPALDIEITEGMFLQNTSPCIERLRELRSFGMKVAIDDFGTGYSSMRYLAQLPIDVLKIDRSFIEPMTRRPEDMAIVSSIISLAQGLRFSTVAEGVETQEQRNMLHLLRCDEMQGYLYSKPVSKAEIELLVAASSET